MLYLVVGGGEMSGFALISCDSQGTTDLPQLSEKCCESQGLLWNSCHMLPHIFFCAVLRLQYSRRLSPCGHLAITDTPPFADKSG